MSNTLNKGNKWFVLVIVSLGLFLIVLDATIIFTALPELTIQLNLDNNQKIWILNIYSLIVAAILPGSGALSDYFGAKKLFLIGTTIFGVGSMIAFFAGDANILILARAILGVGGAILMPPTLSIIRKTFEDPKERGLALSIWGSISAFAAAIGPVVGGLILLYFPWNYLFLIKMPFIVFALIAGAIAIPKIGKEEGEKFNIFGFILIAITIMAFVFGLKELTDPNGMILFGGLLTIISIILLVVFIKYQKSIPNPIIDFNLFSNHKFTAGSIAMFLSAIILAGVDLVLAQKLQLILDYTPFQTGLILMSLAIPSLITGILLGRVIYRLNVVRVQILTLLVCGLGIILLFVFENTPLIFQILFYIIIGSGLGTAMSCAANLIMNNAPVEKSGMAASVEEISFELGSAIGLAFLGGIFTFIYSTTINLPEKFADNALLKESYDYIKQLLPSLNPSDQKILLEAGQQSFSYSYLIILVIGAALCFIAAAIIKKINNANK